MFGLQFRRNQTTLMLHGMREHQKPHLPNEVSHAQLGGIRLLSQAARAQLAAPHLIQLAQ